MAARTHYSKALLGLLETGHRRILPEHVLAYSRSLHVPVESLYDSPNDPLRVAHEWLVNDHPAQLHVRSGRRVGPTLAEQVEQRVITLRLLDDTVGGGDLFPAVSAELHQLRQVVCSASYSEQTGHRLATTLAELAQLAGWVASDAGHHAIAQQLYLSGLSAAELAGNRALAGQLLSSLSYQMATIGDPRDARLLAHTAVQGATRRGDTTPLVVALLHERLAWASARAQDLDATRRILESVNEHYHQRHQTPEPEPHWVYWLNQTEIDVMAGRCLVELGQPRAAEPLLLSALSTYQTEHTRELALYRTWLAQSYFDAGDLDAARETLTLARTASEQVNSARLQQRVTNIENHANQT